MIDLKRCPPAPRTGMRSAPFGIALLSLATAVASNPIVIEGPMPPTEDDPGIWIKLGSILLALMLEFGVVMVWLHSTRRVSRWKVLRSLLWLHLITYPITLWFSAMFGFWAELLPIIVEPWLFTQISGLRMRQVYAPVIIGNTASFAAGLYLPGLLFFLLWTDFFAYLFGLK